VKNKAAVVLATWFGAGFFPRAPGTAGSLAAILIAMALRAQLGWGALEFGVLAACWAAPGVWAASVTAARSGSKDPGIVVIDEVVGQWVTVAGVTAFNWRSWLAAFLIFRLLDIWKPPPVRRLEKLAGGAGIMADDIMAGVYGAVLLYVAGRVNLY